MSEYLSGKEKEKKKKTIQRTLTFCLNVSAARSGIGSRVHHQLAPWWRSRLCKHIHGTRKKCQTLRGFLTISATKRKKEESERACALVTHHTLHLVQLRVRMTVDCGIPGATSCNWGVRGPIDGRLA